jgi:hypothetical protein
VSCFAGQISLLGLVVLALILICIPLANTYRNVVASTKTVTAVHQQVATTLDTSASVKHIDVSGDTVNSVGTVVLVGGALWSAWIFWRKGMMRDRMVGLLLLASGALLVAMGGSLTRLGHEQYLYIAMSAGVLVMFIGYLKTIQPPNPAAVVATKQPLVAMQVQS